MSKAKSSPFAWIAGGALLTGGLVLAHAEETSRGCGGTNGDGANLPTGYIGPGWYWTLVLSTDYSGGAWDAMRAESPGAILPRKTQAATVDWRDLPADEQAHWVLFEVTRPARWTLPGKPVCAPKGAATTSAETIGLGDGSDVPAITSPEHPWNKFWSGKSAEEGGVDNPIITAARALDTAIPWLIYGGAALIAYKLWGLLSFVPSARTPSPRALPPGR